MKLRGTVSSDTGAPLGKAEVTLSGGGHAMPPANYVTTTTADGGFEFEIEPGQYFLRAQRTGYAPVGLPGPMTLAPDRPSRDIELTMIPQAVLTGRVVDEAGEPFEGVRITLISERGPGHGMGQQTNDEGEFRIAGVAPGRYFLQAGIDRMSRMHGHATRQGPETAYPDLLYPGVQDRADARPIEVGRGARIGGLDLQMKPARSYRVRGGVEWPAGARPEQKTLHLVPKPKGGGGIMFGGPTHFAGDTFDYRAVLPGTWLLSASFHSQNQSRHADLELEVTDHDIDGLLLQFPVGVTVTGVVRGVEELERAHLSLDGPAPAGAALSQDGSFSLADVVPGTYRLRLWRLPGDGYVKTVRRNRAPADPDVIPIDGATTLDIEVASDAAVVTGTVDPPQPGAVIQLWRGGPYPAHFATADQDSRFEIRGVAPGEYLVTAARGPWQAAPPAEGQRLRVAPNERATLTLKAQ